MLNIVLKNEFLEIINPEVLRFLCLYSEFLLFEIKSKYVRLKFFKTVKGKNT